MVPLNIDFTARKMKISYSIISQFILCFLGKLNFYSLENFTSLNSKKTFYSIIFLRS